MHKHLTAIAATALLAMAAPISHGALPYYDIDIDVQTPGEGFSIDRVFSGNTPMLRFNVTDHGDAADLSGWAFVFWYGEDSSATTGVSLTGTVTSNTVTFLAVTNAFFDPDENYYCELLGSHTAGYVRTFAYGAMVEKYSPSAGNPATTPQPSNPWNWNSITTYSGTWPIFPGTNVTISTATTGITIHAVLAGGTVTNGQWNESVAGASNLAQQALTTGSLAYALAAAAATGTPLYALGGTYTGDIRAATSAGGALQNVSGSNVVVWGAGGGNSVQFSDGGSFSGTLTVNGGAPVATGTPLYVEAWTSVSNATAQRIASNAAGVVSVGLVASNAQAAAEMAFTNLLSDGSGNAVTSLTFSGQSVTAHRGTISGGTGSETQGLASVLAIDSTTETFRVASSNSVFLSATYNVMVDYDAGGEGYSGNVMIGGGGLDSEGLGQTYNSMSGTTHSVIIGGADVRFIDSMPTSDLEHVRFSTSIASHDVDVVSTPDLEGADASSGVKYNAILAANNIHIYDGQFVGVVSSGGTLTSNASLGALLASSHGKIQNPQTNAITTFFHFGTAAWISNSYAVVFGGRGYSDTNYYRDHGDNSFNIGMGSLWMGHNQVITGNTFKGDGSGLTNLPTVSALAPYVADGTTWSNTWTIPSGYGGIKFVGCLSQNPASGATNGYNINMRINGDTGNNYGRHYTRWLNGTPSAALLISNSASAVAAIYDTIDNVTQFDIVIPCYSGPTRKAFDARSTAWYGNGSDRFDQQGTWRNTNAITTVTIFHSSASNFLTGTIQPYLYPAGVTP